MITFAENQIGKSDKAEVFRTRSESPAPARGYSDEQVNAKYLELMPTISRIAKHAFKDYDGDRRDDAIQSVLVAAFHFVKHLAANGRLHDAYATPLALFAIRNHRCGRPGGVPSSGTDALGERTKWLHRAVVKNYGLAENIADSFESEATATDARYPVSKQVAFKMDFMEQWYENQTSRDREIIKDLAMGETTGDVAKKYGVSAGLISQYRRRYADSWYAFIADNKESQDDLIDALIAAEERYQEEMNRVEVPVL